MMRRVRSSKCGQTERNFRFNSDRVFTSAKHNAMTPRLIPLFIYSALSRRLAVVIDLYLPCRQTSRRNEKAGLQRDALGSQGSSRSKGKRRPARNKHWAPVSQS